MRDFYSHHEPKLMFGPAVLDATPTPAVVDLLGFESAGIELVVGIGGITFTTTNKVEFVAEHSDNGTDYTKLTDADVQGVTGIVDGKIKSLVAAHAAAAVYRFGYHGGKRYLKVTPTFGGTHSSGTPMTGLVIKANPSRSVG